MAPPWRYKVTVYSGNIDRLFLPGGDVWRWGNDVSQETMEVAIAYAPSRSGLLKAEHGRNIVPAGKRDIRWSVFNDAEYARYVHEGTTGPITSTRPGGMLLIRPAPHSFFPAARSLPAVRGQNANPWLANAVEDVMARHGIH